MQSSAPSLEGRPGKEGQPPCNCSQTRMASKSAQARRALANQHGRTSWRPRAPGQNSPDLFLQLQHVYKRAFTALGSREIQRIKKGVINSKAQSYARSWLLEIA